METLLVTAGRSLLVGQQAVRVNDAAESAAHLDNTTLYRRRC